MINSSELISERTQEEITIRHVDVETLQRRFGGNVPRMGRWLADGSLAIPADLIREAASALDKPISPEAANGLKTYALAKMFWGPFAALLIERVSELNKLRFRQLCERLQNTDDEDEAAALTDEIVPQVSPS